MISGKVLSYNIFKVSKKRRCPKCGSKKVIHIVYGFPSPEAQKKAEQGKIELGGCVVTAMTLSGFAVNVKKSFRDEK